MQRFDVLRFLVSVFDDHSGQSGAVGDGIAVIISKARSELYVKSTFVDLRNAPVKVTFRRRKVKFGTYHEGHESLARCHLVCVTVYCRSCQLL